MKILMATMGLDIGGAETHILELSKELRRRGHELIVASNGGVYVPELERAGIRHYAVPMNRRSLLPMAKSYRMLRRILEAEQPDIVHAHARIPAFLLGLLHRRMDFPFVTTAHWVFNPRGVLRFLSDWGQRTLAVSEDIRAYLKQYYAIPDSHIRVTMNGIDTEKFSAGVSGSRIRREFGIDDAAPVLVHVSRLDTGRELAAAGLIAAAPEIAAAVPGAVLLIAGGGDRFAALNAEAEAVNARLGYRCLVLAGPRTDINEIISAGRVFLGVSRAALEAMACEKPVVLAGNEGFQGLFTPEKLEAALACNFCCRGCEPIEAAPLASELIRAMKLPPEELRRLGESGRDAVLRHYSVRRMGDDALALYHDALSARSVVISGYYGFANAGDEAILSAVIAAVRRSTPCADITVLSKTPAETAATYGCGAAARFSPRAVLRAIRGCDLLISGGGSLLQDTTSTRSLLYYVSVIRLAERLRKRVMLFANGIGPISRPLNRRLVGKTLNRADVITLRDGDSLAELQRMLVRAPVTDVTADPVFRLEPAPAEEAEAALTRLGLGQQPFLALSVRSWQGMDTFAPRLALVCDRLYEKYGLPLLFVSLQKDRDAAAAGNVMSRMHAPSFELGGEPKLLMAVIGRAELMLSMRLHSVIFAARMGVPVAGVIYDPKVESALKMLSMPALGTVESFDPEAALKTLSALYESRDARRRELEALLAELQQRGEKDEAYLRALLK